MTDLRVIDGGGRTGNPWWNAFTELETDIRDLRRMAELTVMVLEDDEDLTAFLVYEVRDRTEALKRKYEQLWDKTCKQEQSA
jgi:hypothetical protein